MKNKHLWFPMALAGLAGWLPLGHASIDLGSAASFGVLGAGVTSAGGTVISGDLGVPAAGVITGFGPGQVNGTTYTGGAVEQQAENDATAAYNAILGESSGQDLTGDDLGGRTLLPGVNNFSSSAQLTGTLILNAQGNPNAQFVFQIGSTLTTASDASVELINGAQADNVYWQVGTSATIGTGSVLYGNLIADSTITLNTGASLTGSVIALNGPVTLNDNNVAIAVIPEPNTWWAGMLCVSVLSLGSGRTVWRNRRRLVG